MILIAYFTRLGSTDFKENADAVPSVSPQSRDTERKGNTQIIAEMIHSRVGGDLFLIKTAKEYTADFDALIDYAGKERKSGARPELAAHVENMDAYDTVFLGFPNWWYDMPLAVYSFVEGYDFSRKTVIPFCTSGGSGFSSSIEELRKLMPGARVLEGFAVHESKISGARDDVDKWLRKIGIGG
jgi:flavodoxin